MIASLLLAMACGLPTLDAVPLVKPVDDQPHGYKLSSGVWPGAKWYPQFYMVKDEEAGWAYQSWNEDNPGVPVVGWLHTFSSLFNSELDEYLIAYTPPMWESSCPEALGVEGRNGMLLRWDDDRKAYFSLPVDVMSLPTPDSVPIIMATVVDADTVLWRYWSESVYAGAVIKIGNYCTAPPCDISSLGKNAILPHTSGR